MPSNPKTFLAKLTARLAATQEFKALSAQLSKNRARATTICPEQGNPLLLAATWSSLGKPVLVITPNPDSARRIVDQLPTWLACPEVDEDGSPIFHFAETANIPFERHDPDHLASHQRIIALDALRRYAVDDAQSGPPLVVASIQAIAEQTIPFEVYAEVTRQIRVGDRIEVAATMRHLTGSGYEVLPIVDFPGSISRRGGIIDIFPIGAETPVRIELFDDEVDSMRHFDVDSQRSFEDVESVGIIPAREELPAFADVDAITRMVGDLNTDNIDLTRLSSQRFTDELGLLVTNELESDLAFYSGFFNRGTIFDYLPSETLVIAVRPRMISESASGVDRRLAEIRRVKERRGEIPMAFPWPHLTWAGVASGIEQAQHRLEIDHFGIDDPTVATSNGRAQSEATFALPIRRQLAASTIRPDAFENADDPAENQVLDDPSIPLQRAIDEGANQVVAITSHAARLYELAAEAGIEAQYHTTTSRKAEATAPLVISEGYATSGFALELDDGELISILTDAEIFGIRRQRRRSSRRSVRKGPQLDQLQPGVYVVHVDHGVAKFLGTEAKEPDGREHLVLQYAKDDRVYVPTEHIDRIQIYQGGGESAPRLSRLGGGEWSKSRARAKRATEIVANELLSVYAARMLAKGTKSDPDTPWQQVLEASFPFEETPDQITALEAVKQDMEGTNSMDRIICGDVGFGKTEIALRSAFKAVQSGFQAAVLVPTTLLAQQHFDTFKQRLAPFPISIEVISRFRSREEQKDILERLASGNIDVIIGTHRLIQRDVTFKNLGIVVIDEEQKFGVQHKEHMKKLRAAVDVLTLSATPIPRTLYMSIAGIRDMSNMETAPEERRPVRTFVSESSDDLIREAILREIDGGGQVFFLHNRVKDIERVSRRLRKIVPEASFTIGHGQMPEGQLEEVITAFDRGEYDVLVCTTIIEAGIDMPNVNTLIVNDADRFGLAQLHHIRGRVGRAHKQGYAYLLVQPNKALTEEADARLNTILAATELGSGFKIAMRDLEIRGMGNVIGAEQSGHVAAVGLHMYTQLLAQSVEELKRRRNIGDNGTATNGSVHEVEKPSNGAAVNGSVSTSEWQPTSMIRSEIKLGVDDSVPPDYIEDLAQRLAFHQRLSWSTDPEELVELRAELRDRYGDIPHSVEMLLQTARLRLIAEEADVTSLRVTNGRARLLLKTPVGGAKGQLQRLLGPNARIGNTQIHVELAETDTPEHFVEELAAILETIRNFKQRVMALIGG